MIAFALVNGPLPKVGVIVAAALVALAVLTGGQRVRAGAMLGLLVLAPLLLLSDIWSSPQLRAVHHHPLGAGVVVAAGLALVVVMAVVLRGRPWLLAPLVVATLPFRIPISAGGTTSNLLVPLYVVLAAGTLAYAVPALGLRLGRFGGAAAGSPDGGLPAEADAGSAAGASDGRERPRRLPASAARLVEWLLVAYIVLYALQSAYSLDFQRALQQVVFFYVPFALGFCLLRRLEWNSRLIRTCLLLAVGLAIVFSLVGVAEYAIKTLFLNPKLIATNQDHAYFAVNSVFFDSNIFGRFLSLVMVLLAVTMLHERPLREQVAAAIALAILWVGLVLTLSRSSLGALLAGLAVLAALRWKVSRAVVIAAGVVAVGAAAVAISPHTFGLEQGFNGVFSGRGSLVSGGWHMFGQRPVWGYGSGSFRVEYLRQNPNSPGGVGDSHTLPVTIAAEQGALGELLYVGLLAAALVMLLSSARRDPARAAVGAAFVALIVHTVAYDDFLSDPITWTLLGVGVALARDRRRVPETQPALVVRQEAVPAYGSG
ncbi:MAG: O-antigen ligase family protein [Solirubrobacteraceae bacterium]